ncbi:MAG: DUF4364 family protein [Tissierellales bacterium]|nr:DUF4364 family protein [Tissierellales bacterium]
MYNLSSQEVVRQKLILMFTIKESPAPIDNISLTEILIDKFDINYFLIQEHIKDLLVNEYIYEIESHENIKYQITDKGSQALDYLIDILNDKEKNTLSSIFKIPEKRDEIKEEVSSDYYHKENGEFQVSLKLIEKDEILFSLYLSVPSENQAKLLCDKWNKNPAYFHKSILDLFI